MCALNQPLRIESFQILSDRDLRSAELPGKIGNHNPALLLQDVENRPASLLVQHSVVTWHALAFLTTSLYSLTACTSRCPLNDVSRVGVELVYRTEFLVIDLSRAESSNCFIMSWLKFWDRSIG